MKTTQGQLRKHSLVRDTMKGTWKLSKDSGEQLLCSCGGFSTAMAVNSASPCYNQRQCMCVSQFGHVLTVR